jgi:hypothetical protein
MSVNDQEILNVDRYQYGPWSRQKKKIQIFYGDPLHKSFYDLEIKQTCSRSSQHFLYLDLELGITCGYVDMHYNVKNSWF